MRRHHLTDRAGRSLVDVGERICGLYAQVMSSAKLTAWARVEGLAAEAVSEALWEDRSLVKLWAMRGTLHLLTVRDPASWLGPLGTYEHFLKPAWLRGFDTRDELEALIEAIGVVLADDVLTREALGAAVERQARIGGLAEKVQGSWDAFLKPASFRGRLCFAPDDGQRARFAGPAGWLGARRASRPGPPAPPRAPARGRAPSPLPRSP
jgi:Winged helix DNA-binding domain